MNIYWIVNREQESISTPKTYYLHEGGIVLLMCHGAGDLSHVIIVSAYEHAREGNSWFPPQRGSFLGWAHILLAR